MSNKQESYILPECCNECVEADGFLGAKGCSNRTCECHKESHEGVEETECKDAVCHHCPYFLPDCKNCHPKLTPLVAQQEQKEGVEEECTVEFAREMVKTGHLRGLIECPLHGHHNPYHMSVTGEDMESTPTVKEESHTQGWEEQFDDKFDFLDCAALNGQEIKAFIKEVVEVAEKQAMLRQRHYDEKLARDREASAFDAGYAQCKVDAVAAVPHQRSDMFSYGEGAAAGGAQDGWNACRQAVLAALEVIKNKE